MKKIIQYSKAWKCDSMDLLSNIVWEGYEVLFDDNTRELFDSIPTEYEQATETEIKDFCNSLGFVFVGDFVEIIKGRNIPKGTEKQIKSFFDYKVCYNNTIEYVVFTDGTKTNINNIKHKKSKFDYAFKFNENFNIGGRK